MNPLHNYLLETALGERPSARDWIGIALITAGTVVLALRR